MKNISLIVKYFCNEGRDSNWILKAETESVPISNISNQQQTGMEFGMNKNISGFSLTDYVDTLSCM